MSDAKGPYEYVGSVYELNQMCVEMGDDDLTDALDTVIKLISKPDVPPKAVTPIIVKLQAQAVKFKMQAKWFMLFQKEGDAAKKKNVYLSMSEALKDLVDSLKYLAKAY
jgi:hypothetical protein